MRESHDPDQALVLQALLYAGGELDDAEAAAFEARLGEDQAAREALAQAVHLTLTVGGQRADARPDPAWKQRARQRLTTPSLWQRLAGKHSYRGHPLVWTGMGAAAAVLLMLATAPVAPTPAPIAHHEEAAPAAPTAEAATVWADLHNTDHVDKAIADENRRKTRGEDRRVAKIDDRRSKLAGQRH